MWTQSRRGVRGRLGGVVTSQTQQENCINTLNSSLKLTLSCVWVWVWAQCCCVHWPQLSWHQLQQVTVSWSVAKSTICLAITKAIHQRYSWPDSREAQGKMKVFYSLKMIEFHYLSEQCYKVVFCTVISRVSYVFFRFFFKQVVTHICQVECQALKPVLLFGQSTMSWCTETWNDSHTFFLWFTTLRMTNLSNRSGSI